MIPIDIKSGSKKLTRMLDLVTWRNCQIVRKLKDIFEFETSGFKEPNRGKIFFPEQILVCRLPNSVKE